MAVAGRDSRPGDLDLPARYRIPRRPIWRPGCAGPGAAGRRGATAEAVRGWQQAPPYSGGPDIRRPLTRHAMAPVAQDRRADRPGGLARWPWRTVILRPVARRLIWPALPALCRCILRGRRCAARFLPPVPSAPPAAGCPLLRAGRPL